VFTKLRIDNLLHDFCDDCWTKLKTLLEGTGTAVIELQQPYQYPNQGIITVPNNPGIVPIWTTGGLGQMNASNADAYTVIVTLTGGNGDGKTNFVGNVVTDQDTFMSNGSVHTVLMLNPMKE
jgi:hypothetical protein